MFICRLLCLLVVRVYKFCFSVHSEGHVNKSLCIWTYTCLHSECFYLLCRPAAGRFSIRCTRLCWYHSERSHEAARGLRRLPASKKHKQWKQMKQNKHKTTQTRQNKTNETAQEQMKIRYTHRHKTTQTKWTKSYVMFFCFHSVMSNMNWWNKQWNGHGS